MKDIIIGKSHKLGNNIDTDQICPGVYLELTDPKEIGSHCLEGADGNFLAEYVTGDIVVAGTNFGCGSSREHAAISLKAVGVGAVVAESFARIFYRNGINMGVPLIIAPNISTFANEGDELKINMEQSMIENITTGKSLPCEAISEYALNILKAGGIKPILMSK